MTIESWWFALAALPILWWIGSIANAARSEIKLLRRQLESLKRERPETVFLPDRQPVKEIARRFLAPQKNTSPPASALTPSAAFSLKQISGDDLKMGEDRSAFKSGPNQNDRLVPPDSSLAARRNAAQRDAGKNPSQTGTRRDLVMEKEIEGPSHLPVPYIPAAPDEPPLQSVIVTSAKPNPPVPRKTQPRKTRGWGWQLALWGGRAGGVLAIGAFLVFAGVYAAFKYAEPVLPLGSDLYALNRPPAYTFMDQGGQRLGFKGPIVGDRLVLSDMPAYLPAAFLTVEDRRFYEHNGIDVHGLLRAAKADYEARGYVQGGSTITQQLVKMLILTPERTLSRKLTEMSGALALERHLSKTQILELYLNRIYLGSGAYGVDGASRAYFGKSARSITLAQAAMLASLTTAPSTFSPRHDLQMARARADRVLAAMAASGTISEKDLAEARAHPVTLTDVVDTDGRGYFLDLAEEETKSLTNDAPGDFTIVTTFDPAMQQAAHSAIETVMGKRGAAMNASQAALVAMTPDGTIKALIGGRSYADSTFNRATQAHRQPGSAFKPMVYLTALQEGLQPWTVRTDEPITIKNWSPDNFGGSYRGDVTLAEALARSINSIAVQLGQEVGLKKVIATARRLGIESPLEPNPSLPLGTSEVTPLELTGAYASFASEGLKARPHTIVEIKDAKGSFIYRRPETEAPRVIVDEDVLALNGMMYQVVQWGTGSAAKVPGHEVAGKTGTSTDFHDAWFIGFSSNLVAGVWVGNDDSTSMKKVTGGTLPAQIWTGFMRTALKGVKATPLPRSHNIPPPAPNAAIASDTGRGGAGVIFDGIGDFFDRLTGSRSDEVRPVEPSASSPTVPNPIQPSRRYSYPPSGNNDDAVMAQRYDDGDQARSAGRRQSFEAVAPAPAYTDRDPRLDRAQRAATRPRYGDPARRYFGGPQGYNDPRYDQRRPRFEYIQPGYYYYGR